MRWQNFILSQLQFKTFYLSIPFQVLKASTIFLQNKTMLKLPIILCQNNFLNNCLGSKSQQQQKENLPPVLESFSNLTFKTSEPQGCNIENSLAFPSPIDLTSALIQQNSVKPSSKGLKSKPEPDKHFKTSDAEVVLLCNDSLHKQSDISHKLSPSKLGNVICRQWTQKHSALNREPVQNKISRFMFDTPSPDDAIRDAQKSSGISNRHFLR